jgi:uncharacterized protein (TIGR02246 family)
MLQRQLLLITFGFALLLAPAAATAQSGDQLYTATRQQLDVTKVILAQEAAWNTGDLDGYLSHYKDAPDTQAVLGSPAVGLNNIRAAFHTNFPNRDTMGAFEPSEIQVKALGDNFALVSGRFHLHRSKKGGGDVEGSFSDVLEKTAAGWQIIFSVST